MLEYAIEFYNNNTFLFYFILVITVIIEGPITILALSLISSSLEIGFFTILIFAFIGDFFGDLLHYFVGRFFKNKLIKRDFSIVKKVEEKLIGHSLMDKLIVIKYTPPITSLGLLYLGYIKTNFISYSKNGAILSAFSAIFITSIGYNFGYLFKDKNDFTYLLIGLFLSFAVFYFLLKLFTKYLIKKIYE
ncbi:MAG: hypothetical protein PHH98_02840 [Candidatus Gracilibacteria bacterium]|nr:hypothetical protein [Candidatus Gracilibacteria bacterium]